VINTRRLATAKQIQLLGWC